MPLFSLKNANRIVPLQDKIFSYTRPFCSDRVVFERILFFWWGQVIFKLRTALEETSVELKTRLEKMDNGPSICQSAVVTLLERSRRWHDTLHWDPPVHHYYGYCSSRILTFRKWSPDIKQTPQALSEAGFFYEGKALF